MAFSLSPAVTVTETDLTTTVPTVASSIAGVVGAFSWGPVNQRQLITSPDNLVSTFGLPNDTNFNDWFQAYNFLAYSNNLYTSRTVAADAVNSSDVQALTTIVENFEDFETKLTTLNATTNTMLARYPGVFGDTISVSYASGDDFATWTHRNLFDFAPSTAAQEIALVVMIDGDVKEQYLLSAVAGTKDYQGNTMYVLDAVNRRSQYIFILEDFLTVDVGGVSTLTTDTIAFTNGADGATPTAGNYQLAIDDFSDDASFDLNFTIQTSDSTVGKYWLDNVTSTRRDCIGIVTTTQANVVGILPATAAANTVTERGNFGSSSYGFMVDNYKYQYDKYNDKWRWVAFCGDVAGLMAQATDRGEPWTSPAGYTNGQIKNVERLAYNPTKELRDLLYKNQINPIVNDSGAGSAVLLGDKTLLSEPSAFGFYNVRRLFIVVEKAIATASKYQLFDFNDEFSRTTFRNMVNPYLRNIQAKRGMFDFRVLCNDTNNPPEIVDQGQFVADIFIKQNRTIQGMNLNFIATKTGVDFDEIINQSNV